MSKLGIQRASLTIAAVLCAAISAELVTRLVAPVRIQAEVRDAHAAEERREAENANPIELRGQQTEARLYLQTPNGRRLRANTTATLEMAEGVVVVRTNSIGYRNPEISTKLAPRVLFLGDSITLGEWLPEESTFVRRIEAIARSRERPIECINAAVAGIGLSSQCSILIETGLSTKPDVVVLGFYLNDVVDSPGVRFRRPPAALAWSRIAQLLAGNELVEVKDLSPADLARWHDEIATRYPPGEGDPRRDRGAFNRLLLDERHIRDWSNVWAESPWRRMRMYFETLRDLAVEHEFMLLFLCFPHRAQVEADPLWNEPQQRLSEVAGDLGAPVLDLLPALRESYRAEEEVELFIDHCHHSVRGQEILAERIEAFLAEHMHR